jgi:hypothetical protein
MRPNSVSKFGRVGGRILVTLWSQFTTVSVAKTPVRVRVAILALVPHVAQQ